MHQVYILKSVETDQYYIGETANLEERLRIHNDVSLNEGFTKKGIPWVVIFTISCADRRQALAIEKHLKRMKSRKYIENIMRYEEISEKLLEKYK